MIGFLFLTLITTFEPPRPTVGDPITITFAAPTTVDPSNDYEVVSRSGNTVVIRSFVPHTIAVNGRSAEGPVTLMVPIHSVLKPDDKLEPAPLKPPKPESWPRLPYVAIGIAAVVAIGVWTAVILLARRRMTKPHVAVVPSEQFRDIVLTLRDAPMRWARLADAVRAYLAAVRSDWGAELTTSELLARVDDSTVSQILRQGDLEKFSPWGAETADFDEMARQALEIPSWAEPPLVVPDEVAA